MMSPVRSKSAPSEEGREVEEELACLPSVLLKRREKKVTMFGETTEGISSTNSSLAGSKEAMEPRREKTTARKKKKRHTARPDELQDPIFWSRPSTKHPHLPGTRPRASSHAGT
jgi:hypothetical protein